MSQADKISQNTPVNSKKSSNASILTIPELGVQIKLSDSLSKLSYTVKNNNVLFSTSEMDVVINKCNDTPNNPGQTFDVVSKNAGQYSASGGAEIGLLKQFSNFWIGGISAIQGVVCATPSDNQELTSLYASTHSALVEAFKTATLAQ